METTEATSTYEVTGVDVHGRRFPVKRFNRLTHARCINLYRGTVWERKPDGKRVALWRVWN